MTESSLPAWRFVTSADAEVERLPGKTHYWYAKPGMVAKSDLMFVRAILPPGEAHPFHHHPKMEEILYILSGTAEQWVEREKKMLQPGDAVCLPVGIVHGTYNPGPEPLEFLAILSPSSTGGPVTVEVAREEPWCSLRR